MTPLNFRRYPRNSPQAAGRIVATAMLAIGDILRARLPGCSSSRRLHSGLRARPRFARA
jgi:hypothetical protein